jgi:N-acetyl-anhydromuramyl-L-alanine amidase AmpD
MNRRSILALAGLGLLASAVPIYWAARWRYIVIHHSGGSYGNIKLLRRVHRERQAKDPIDMIPYHFLIGNGNGLPMGEVVPTRRWDFKIWGAHLSARNADRNFRGIGICLIGNFDQMGVPEDQFRAAVKLTRELMHRFGIAPAEVSFHGETPGESTLCPGTHFPRKRFMKSVSEAHPSERGTV